MPRNTQRLLWPFLGMLALSIALQAASLVAMLEIEARADRSQQHVAAAADLGAIVEQFENTTYRALVGLASSDWELLLRQRAAAQTQADRFLAVSKALLQEEQREGGVLPLDGIQEPEVRGVLSALPGSWEKAHAAHVRVLRSENRSLKNNPDLEQFRAASRRLVQALDDVSAILQRRTQAELRQLGLVQRVIPVGTFLLTLVIFVFVIQRILLPFVASTEELALSEAALRAARKYALNGNPPGERRLTVRLELPTDDRVRVQVCDNGMGIAPELLTKIFQHGFTTRKEGHGFGLHSCAIAARSMEGSLGVHSDGPGKGAIFTLELPFQPETRCAER